MEGEDELKIIMMLVLGILFGIYSFLKGFHSLWFKRMIENTPTSKIRSIAMGPAEVKGKIKTFQKLLTSKLAKQKCVYYRYLVERKVRTKKGYRWDKVSETEESTHFFLDDGTGQVLVYPKGAHVSIPHDVQKVSGDRRYTEYYILPEETLYVLGTAGDNPFVEETTGQKNYEDIMIQKGDTLFYISDSSEKELLQKYGSWVFFGILGGPLISFACLWMLVTAIPYFSSDLRSLALASLTVGPGVVYIFFKKYNKSFFD